MNKTSLLGLLIGLIAISCTDPNLIGLEVQPTSENIIISSTSFTGINSNTESEDSLRTDEALNLILGEISNDDIFGYNNASFLTQIMLTENNIDLGDNPIVDSVILSYAYSGYYGNLEEFTSSLEVLRLSEDIYKDSVYYNNSFEIGIGNIDNIDTVILSDNIDDPFLRVKLTNQFGQEILELGSLGLLENNEIFLNEFKGISVLASSTNTMLYLNPNGSKSYLKIYYSNDDSGSDTLSLDFELGGDAARINLFNAKPLSALNQDLESRYVQSMAGYKIKISINNTDSIEELLLGKVINKVTMSFDVQVGSQSEYGSHDKLFLVRVDEDGNNIFLSDYTIEGATYFGGNLENEKYEFNITRYFYQLINNSSYTNDLYLLPAGAAVNANRTILKEDIILTIHYSQL